MAANRYWLQTVPKGFQGPGTKLQHEAPCVCDRSEQKGQKAMESRELNLEAVLEPCRLILVGDSLNTSKEAVNKILVLVDEPPRPQGPRANCPLCPSLRAALVTKACCKMSRPCRLIFRGTFIHTWKNFKNGLKKLISKRGEQVHPAENHFVIYYFNDLKDCGRNSKLQKYRIFHSKVDFHKYIGKWKLIMAQTTRNNSVILLLIAAVVIGPIGHLSQ